MGIRTLVTGSEVGLPNEIQIAIALQVIDEAEAQQIFAFLKHIDELDELDSGEPGPAANRADCNVESAS